MDELFEFLREVGYLFVMKEVDFLSKILWFLNYLIEVERYMIENWVGFIDKICFVCSLDWLVLGVVRGIVNVGGCLLEEFGVIGFDGVFLD